VAQGKLKSAGSTPPAPARERRRALKSRHADAPRSDLLEVALASCIRRYSVLSSATFGVVNAVTRRNANPRLIAGHLDAKGTPDFEEIAQQFGFHSLATVHEHLTNLERKGTSAGAYESGIEIIPPRTDRAPSFPCSAWCCRQRSKRSAATTHCRPDG